MATQSPQSGASPAQRPVQVKLVLLGEAAVGKSSVVLRFVQNDFQENKEPTIGAAFLTQKCRLEDKVIKFEIWDTAGQERFHSLAPMYYRNAQAAVVAYDVTKGPSLDKAKSWVKELQRQANPNIVIALIGNKLDLVQADLATGDAHGPAAASGSDDDDDSEADDATATPSGADGASSKPAAAATGSASKRQVSREEAEAYAQEAGLLFFETSAKTGDGVVEVFTEIAKKIPLEHILSSTGARPSAQAGGRNASAGGNAPGGQGGRVRLGGAGAQGEGQQGKDGCAC